MKLTGSLGALLMLWCLNMGAHAEGKCAPGYYLIGGGATAGGARIPGNGGTSGVGGPDGNRLALQHLFSKTAGRLSQAANKKAFLVLSPISAVNLPPNKQQWLTV